MNPVLSTPRTWLVDVVRRIAALEYALIEACHAAAQSASGFAAALFSTRAGAAQVHLFDLGSVLRELGDASLSYSRCIRQALLQSGTPDEVLRRLERESKRAIERADAPEQLRHLLRSNLEEHRRLGESMEGYAIA